MVAIVSKLHLMSKNHCGKNDMERNSILTASAHDKTPATNEKHKSHGCYCENKVVHLYVFCSFLFVSLFRSQEEEEEVNDLGICAARRINGVWAQSKDCTDLVMGIRVGNIP